MDRKQVKKELLELNAEAYGLWVHDQKNEFLAQIGNVTDDALALLEEQEAVEPVPPEDEFVLYRCGKCYHQLFRCVDKYCSRCGRKVKWNERDGEDFV